MLWPQAPDVWVRLAGVFARLCLREMDRGRRAINSVSFGLGTQPFIWWNSQRSLPPIKIKRLCSSRTSRDRAEARDAKNTCVIVTVATTAQNVNQNVIRKRRRVVRRLSIPSCEKVENARPKSGLGFTSCKTGLNVFGSTAISKPPR
jgi:hypothetical protein